MQKWICTVCGFMVESEEDPYECEVCGQVDVFEVME